MNIKNGRLLEKLAQKKLKELLTYNQETGIFTWKERQVEMFNHCENPQIQCKAWNARFAGKQTGYKWKNKKAKTFYMRIGITLNKKSKLYLAHRLVFLYTEGQLPSEDVDHIDGDGTNNREDNLRKVSRQENHKNRSINSTNTSGYIGVYWYKVTQKWRVQIKVKGETKNGGYFKNKEDAIAKRKEMEIEYGFHENHGRK